MPKVSVADVKSHLSELIAKIAHGRERQGLVAVASSWPDFEEVAKELADLGELRRQGGKGRDVCC